MSGATTDSPGLWDQPQQQWAVPGSGRRSSMESLRLQRGGARKTEAREQTKVMVVTPPTDLQAETQLLGSCSHMSWLRWPPKVIKSLITQQVAIKCPQSSSSSPEPTTRGLCFERVASLSLGFASPAGQRPDSRMSRTAVLASTCSPTTLTLGKLRPLLCPLKLMPNPTPPLGLGNPLMGHARGQGQGP